MTANEPRLPVLDVLDDVRAALADRGAAVLVAPPGTGKTTAVPPALIDEPWAAGGRVLVVQPRRLAARRAAARMAAVRGEPVGATCGYSVRGDRRAGPTTRVELVTEGLALRRLQVDPALEGPERRVTAVLLDEFHERSLDVDLLLALLIDIRSSLRPDLRLLVMSATLQPGPVAARLGDAAIGAVPVITATAPQHPVRTLHRPGRGQDRIEDRVATVIHESLDAGPESDGALGDVLVFLPGRGEIRRTAERLSRGVGAEVVVHQLHGSVPAAEQDAALAPDPRGRRRVVLATAIAETSITVDGVRIVIDSGRRRTLRVHAATGLPGLTTTPVSLAGADQRRGRAGRTGPGTCYRLWSAEEERHRATADPPEILESDLAGLLLQVLAWGAHPGDLPFLDPPAGPHLAAAGVLLADLGATDSTDPDTTRLTARGRTLAQLGFHPRLGAVVHAALDGPLGRQRTAELAALLEVDPPGDPDLVERLLRMSRGERSRELADATRDWRNRLPRDRGRHAEQDDPDGIGSAEAIGAAASSAILAGYRDRLARRRDGDRTDGRGRQAVIYQLVGGGEVALQPPDDPLSRSRWLAVASLDRGDTAIGRTAAGPADRGRIQLAVAVDDSAAEAALRDRTADVDEVFWDGSRREVRAVRRRQVGSITLDERPWRDPPSEALRAALADGVRIAGAGRVFDRWPEAEELRARLALSRPTPDATGSLAAATAAGGSASGDPTDDGRADDDVDLLVARAAFTGRVSRADLATLDVARWLLDGLSWTDRTALEEWTPLHLDLLSGRRVRVRYGAEGPVVSTRLQDLLGTDTHPTVGIERVPVTVELLSPAGRPLQRTSDLPGFWRGSYAAVRAEMRGRYPKHRWPERPWEPIPGPRS
ncbi:MAG TPA: ATP-dependent helicase HrpB [Microthrixaceae bacterium]|nr:ATP-dependent helicase HrpB [Microthrixaceae bacterium]